MLFTHCAGLTCVHKLLAPRMQTQRIREKKPLQSLYYVCYNLDKRTVKHIAIKKKHTYKHISYQIQSFLFVLFIVRPLSIQLIGENRPLSAEIPVNVSCRVTGAKPPPIVTWWKDSTQMTDAKQIVSRL